MHMADALVSPVVGGTMWGISAGMIGYCSNRIRKSIDDKTVPLMGVLGAFVFAAQMINFTIPATGSSGHLGGGLLLAVLLGPSAALLTIASILTVQALFFADGGLLALGCNIFNMGVLPCMIAYPLVYKPITGNSPTQIRIIAGSLLAAIIGLQLGSFGVVLQTLFSGITDLPLRTFILFMQPIHLAIGIVEGLATASIVMFLYNAQPEILDFSMHGERSRTLSIRKPLVLFVSATLLTACILSLFASEMPDGLEWSIFKTTGTEEISGQQDTMHNALNKVQDKTALLPDYGFKQNEQLHESAGQTNIYFSPETGTSFSGLIGSIATLLVASLLGLLLKRKKAILGNS